ncbi:hypothetical protein BVX99_01340 [bacterium F16]|nr:hypothetical protein BVX99_01340 [bacterium F16]
MKRRDFIKTAGAVALASSFPDSALGDDAESPMPNILLIFSDQQHWQALGFMDSFFDTPNLDKLAKESVVFDRSFCTTPQCSPSRSSLLTGFYPSATKVMGNCSAAGGAELTQPTIAPELQAAGYRTGYFGKWHLGNKDVACAGWDDKVFKTHDPTAQQETLAFLRDPATQTKPFALFVSINNPHDIYQFKQHTTEKDSVPLSPSWEEETFANKPPIQQQFMNEDQGKTIIGKPRKEWEKYHDCYRKQTKLYDDNVGTIIAELKTQGKWDDTIVIITSDHGDMDAQHKLIFKGPFMYEHMMRVPLMIRLPKGTNGGRRIDTADAVNVDLVPTIRELVDLPKKSTHGLSLAPLLTKKGNYEAREFVVGQYYSKQKWVNPIRMIRTKDYKLNRHITWGDELYDLKNDPHELTNRADDPKYTKIKKDLGNKLNQWIKDHKDPFYSFAPTTRKGKPLVAENTK